MTTENSTTPTQAATLAEKELWTRFLGMTIKRTMSLGPTVEVYTPNDLVADPGSYGLIDSFSLSVARSIAESEQPELDLGMWISDLEGYVHWLKQIHSDFQKFKSLSLVFPPQPDFRTTTPEHYKAWERAANAADENPRYTLPASLAVQEAE